MYRVSAYVAGLGEVAKLTTNVKAAVKAARKISAQTGGRAWIHRPGVPGVIYIDNGTSAFGRGLPGEEDPGIRKMWERRDQPLRLH